MNLLIGVDLGTTGCKAVVYDEAGTVLGESYLELDLITLSDVMIEQSPDAWWEAMVRAVGLALAAAHADREAVRGIAISSQGIAFVLLDAQDRPLGNAISWLDGRATVECARILARYSARSLFQITGKRAAPFYVLPKLLWVRAQQPEVWRRARRLLMAHDYLVYRLCGERVTDHSLAGGTLLYDLHRQDWSQELLDAFDIPADLLPPVCWAGTRVGTLRPEAAAALGLTTAVVVAVGGQDQKCAALGAGLVAGTASVSLGTASAVVQLLDRPATDPQLRIPTFAFVQPACWVLEGVVATAAGCLRWYRDTLAPGASYADLDAEAAGAPPGSDGLYFYPHLSGASSPHWLSAGRGALHGLSLATSRSHLTRALMEGVAFQIRENLAITEEIGGPVAQVILFGGGARSGLWRAIIGDVLARPVVWPRTMETASGGAAMLAGTGSGVFATLDEARGRMLAPLGRREPDAAVVALYVQHYERYRRVEAALLSLASEHP